MGSTRLHEGVDAREMGQLTARKRGDAPVDDALGRFQTPAVGLIDLLLQAGEWQGALLLKSTHAFTRVHAFEGASCA